MVAIFLDIIMIGLLATAIYGGWYINERLKFLRQVSSDLGPTLRNLSAILTQTTRNIDELKQTSQEMSLSLSQQLPKAATLKEDLQLLVEHADKIAVLLEKTIEKAQQTRRTYQVIQEETPIMAEPVAINQPATAPQTSRISQVLSGLKGLR